MNGPRILVGGIGNIFLGDDAFGSEVARRLLTRTAPEGVRVVDFGIRSFDLYFALEDNYDAVVLIDATPRGGAPGTLYVIEPERDATSTSDLLTDGHQLDTTTVLRLAANLGTVTRRVLLIGCEPAAIETETMGLSEPVEAAVDEAVALVESLVAGLGPELSKPGSS
jgi:hydrogenase maturation protease